MPDKRFFYVNPSKVDGDKFTLDETESHHLSHVLRINSGEMIWLLDGSGMAYEGRVEQVGESVTGIIQETHKKYGEPNVDVHIAVGIIKRDRFELLLEKGTEVGVKSISPLILDRCIKKSINLERCENIVQSAAKQCGRSVFPKILQPVPLNEWLAAYPGSDRAVLHWDGKRSIREFSAGIKNGTAHFIVGPEGDFNEVEISKIKKTDIDFISLGERRLRSETAAITAASFLINFNKP
ncbi:MAG: 16S rRNA (uracil(1498)-N(3))-methyltransferase [Candidatus Marinimicrobia bacterium]|jgi:16S rRNA (uracil1498-N3)-methyltransferase|nr:16S rRNA (uracil(1498)-N(3))-methyltransferase [Candidatus Neomarinimicrobiota bacterium]MBT3618378.1 16S rRNA (uracil(1498)-N(3))-methyltransferase [Candidatus Neomarinimicrobiota bacterium]MBT3829173.1 16S rRNA (uracil(1498)-N(3))-methyltransferase [Candidatus Neomarinimicrobiota bacterium]MBT3998141.1 16S rRNA (uracil(1498)-N(3))-methyltransferase [Candidatus Neomarinimicrobiota bacterium]MBT4281482.1 16S rRNA (uracil(1498)-N(3))-methyltransferase [Candidatus Neomarinimicrobiota bacterium